MAAFPCPCCGHLTFAEQPGSYDICPVCFWEDDNVQLRWPDSSGGANTPSLIEAQRNYADFGAMEVRFKGNVRQPLADDPVDRGWRPVDLHIDRFESRTEANTQWPADLTVLYWWRPTFWRLSKGVR